MAKLCLIIRMAIPDDENFARPAADEKILANRQGGW